MIAARAIVVRPQVRTMPLTTEVRTDDMVPSFIEFDFSGPVQVKEDTVDFAKEDMNIGEWYPFIYRGQERLAIRRDTNVIEIYRVRR